MHCDFLYSREELVRIKFRAIQNHFANAFRIKWREWPNVAKYERQRLIFHNFISLPCSVIFSNVFLERKKCHFPVKSYYRISQPDLNVRSWEFFRNESRTYSAGLHISQVYTASLPSEKGLHAKVIETFQVNPTLIIRHRLDTSVFQETMQ